MAPARLVIASLAAALLTGCGISDARRHLDESTARLNAQIQNEVRTGRLTPDQAMDLEDTAAAQRAAITTTAPDYAPTPALFVPTYQAPTALERPPQPHIGPPPAAIPDYRASPIQGGPQFVPYGAVAPLMPGIAPGGTAR